MPLQRLWLLSVGTARVRFPTPGEGSGERLGNWAVDNRTMQRSLIGLVAAFVLAVVPLVGEVQAQGRGNSGGNSTTSGRGSGSSSGADTVPAAYRPPAGMCRVWINGVQPARQPAPTTCPVAIKNMQANARLLYGPDPNTKKAPGTVNVTTSKLAPPTTQSSKTLPPKVLPPRRDTLPRSKRIIE